jgi:hypothetical protein
MRACHRASYEGDVSPARQSDVRNELSKPRLSRSSSLRSKRGPSRHTLRLAVAVVHLLLRLRHRINCWR